MNKSLNDFIKAITIPVVFVAIGFTYNNNFFNRFQQNKTNVELEHKKKGPPPLDPLNNYTQEEMLKARKEHKKNIENSQIQKKSRTKSTVNILPSWKFRGPKKIGGRVTSIVADAENTDKVYVGSALGGVWKSTDGGAHYKPIFDNAGSLMIGALALDIHDSNIIYVGTGDYNDDTPNADGIWKSINGGDTWEHLNLKTSEAIRSIIINPNNNELFVAVSDGVFRSSNGGGTWKKIFNGNDITDIQMDPKDSNNLYLIINPNSILKSEDSGKHWNKLNIIDDEQPNTITFAIAPSSPNRLYYVSSSIINNTYSYTIYRSDDYGKTWKKVSNLGDGSANYPGYCGKMFVSPIDKDKIYLADMIWYISSDGGETFPIFGGEIDHFWTHVDKHALWISPNGETIYEGNDGGIYKSENSGSNFEKQDIPISQFYAIEVDPINHNKILGGMQDNGSAYGTADNNWKFFDWGDGFTVLVDNTDTRYVYSESQNGYVSISKNMEILNGIPIPGDKPWHMKMLLDPSNNKIAYYGAGGYLYRTVRTGDTISTPEKVSTINFEGDIDSIDIAKNSQGNTIYLGTYSAIWVSKDRGISWEKRTSGLPTTYNTSVTIDPHNNTIAYASFFAYGETKRPIYRTTNYGKTWTDISGNLPHGTVYDVLVDPDYSSTLYCSTDFGVYVSYNTGKYWKAFVQGLPQSRVKDLKILKEHSEAILYAGTYGRGIYSARLTNIQRRGYSSYSGPSAPSNLKVIRTTQTTATLTWTDKSTTETGFKIYNGYELVATLNANTTSYHLVGLSAKDTINNYNVTAYNSKGESDDAVNEEAALWAPILIDDITIFIPAKTD